MQFSTSTFMGKEILGQNSVKHVNSCTNWSTSTHPLSRNILKPQKAQVTRHLALRIILTPLHIL